MLLAVYRWFVEFDWEKATRIFQSLATGVSLVVGGVWVYYRFVLQRERYPNINFACEVNLIGKQHNDWLVEIVAIVENKGKAQHQMSVFTFSLNAITQEEKFRASDQWGGQASFPHLIREGSFLPKHSKYFFVDPGVTDKYSYVTTVPLDYSYLLLHCNFEYKDGKRVHTAERTLKVPTSI